MIRDRLRLRRSLSSIVIESTLTALLWHRKSLILVLGFVPVELRISRLQRVKLYSAFNGLQSVSIILCDFCFWNCYFTYFGEMQYYVDAW